MNRNIEAAPVLADIGRINMLFSWEAAPPGPRWRPLHRSAFTPQAVAAEVERVRERLAGAADIPARDVEWRVAASIFHQGLATRLLSPVLAAALCHGAALRTDTVHWDPETTGPTVLRSNQRWADPIAPDPAAVADHITATVLTAVLEPVAAALGAVPRSTGRVAPGLLHGNTASALAGAARSLGSARPAARAGAEDVVRLVTASPPLAGTGAYTGRGPDGTAVFGRTTCCLYYRVPGSGYCGDCALTPPGKTR